MFRRLAPGRRTVSSQLATLLLTTTCATSSSGGSSEDLSVVAGASSLPRRTTLQHQRRYYCNSGDDAINPEDISFVEVEADDGGASGGGRTEEGNGNAGGEDDVSWSEEMPFRDVATVDTFARAKVLNFIKRLKGGNAPNTGTEENAQIITVREVRSCDETHFHAVLQIPFPGEYGSRRAEGIACNAKDAETLAAMHAESIIDAFGFQLYTLPSMQKKHAEGVRSVGRWAPFPEDPQRPSTTPLPPPLRRILTVDESEDGTWRLLDTKPRNFRTPPHTILTPAIVDNNALQRIRRFVQARKKIFDEIIEVTQEKSQHKGVPDYFVATLPLPLPAEYGKVVAKGKAMERQLAIVLAAMHAELVIDTLGFPLFPNTPDFQHQHAAAARAFGRYAPDVGEPAQAPGTATPLPLKQYIPAGKRMTALSPDERLLGAHQQLIDESKTFTSIFEPDQEAMPAIRNFMKTHSSHPVAREDPFFVEKVGMVYRCSLVLPLPEEYGVRGGVGFGDTPTEAEILSAMHGIEVLNTLGVPVYQDEEMQAQHIERRRRMGKLVPGDVSDASRTTQPSPAAFKRAVQTSEPKMSTTDRALHRLKQREEQLKRMSGVAKPVSVARTPRPATISYKQQQSSLEEHHWNLKADSQDGFILVSPKQKIDNSVSLGHTLYSIRQMDLLARERIIEFLESHGRRASECITVSQTKKYDQQIQHRCTITIPVPANFGVREAIGEAPEAREAELLAAMHAELIIDTLGLPLYRDGGLQQKHAEAARKLGRFSPMPGEHHQPPSTPSPPGLRKATEDSIEWLRHVKHMFGKDASIHLKSDIECRDKREAEMESYETIREDQLDSTSKARVQTYLRRVTKKVIEADFKVQGSATTINHIASLQLPLPEKFGQRVASGMAMTKKEAETLCYMHAERTIDCLGVRLFNLPGLQKRHAERVAKGGRWAPSTDKEEKPGDTPSPHPLRLSKVGPKPKYPLPPAPSEGPVKWDHYVRQCDDYIKARRKHERDVFVSNERVPRTGDPLIDETLDEVERKEVDRQSKSLLYNYCFKCKLKYPTSWPAHYVGPADGRMSITTVEVPGFEHIQAFGIAKNKDLSQRRAAMHCLALIRRLDPGSAALEPGAFDTEQARQEAQAQQRKKQDGGIWDREAGSFTEEGRVRLIDLYTVANDLNPPRIVHRQKQNGKIIVYTTTVEVVDADGMRYVGKTEATGRKVSPGAAYSDLFHMMARNIPAFRSLMSLLKKHPHLDPEHVMSINLPPAVESRITELTQDVEGEEDAETAPIDTSVDSNTAKLLSRATETAEANKAKILERSALLKRKHEEKLANETYREKFEKRRTTLSIHDHKQILLDTIHNNQITVICGTTGCGKTTQVPQFILDDAAEKGKGGECSILVTQPRRISAISIAQRIADERLESIGRQIGYTIRLDSKPGSNINFCTSGVLLRLLQAKPELDGVNYIIIDEIHERDINSDFLLILVKDLMRRRKDLRVILMSATLQSELFAGFFGGAPVINVEGYVYPVKEMYLDELAEHAKEKGVTSQSFKAALKEANSDSLVPPPKDDKANEGAVVVDFNAVLFAIDHAARTEENVQSGSILVFLPGWEEITKIRDQVSTGKYHVITLHSSVGSDEQLQCFKPAPEGKIKLVLSTNIAESGVTIDDIAVVIDAGLAKEKSYILRRGRTKVGRNELGTMSQLMTVFASRANCIQRRGRAGRTRPGTCIRLYTKHHFLELPDFQVPEMLRQPLDSLCLQIMSLGLGDPAEFLQRALEPPPMESIESAMSRLRNLGAMNDSRVLSALGQRLAMLPVIPRVGKMILFGAVLRCLDSALTIAATTDTDPFVSNRDQKDVVRVHREELAANSQSDHIATLNAFNVWATANALKTREEAEKVVGENMLHEQSLLTISKYKRQFYDILVSSGFLENVGISRRIDCFVDDSPFSSDSCDVGLVKGVICAGLFPNVALSREKKVYRSKLDNMLSPHPGSVVNKVTQDKINNPYFIFEDLMRSTTDLRVFMTGGTNVSMWAIMLLGASNLHIDHRDDLNLGLIDDWIVFRASSDTLHLIKKLKMKLNVAIVRKFVDPHDKVNNELLDQLHSVIKILLGLPTRPNELVSTVWEERGLISEGVAMPTGTHRYGHSTAAASHLVGSDDLDDAENEEEVHEVILTDDEDETSGEECASALEEKQRKEQASP